MVRSRSLCQLIHLLSALLGDYFDEDADDEDELLAQYQEYLQELDEDMAPNTNTDLSPATQLETGSEDPQACRNHFLNHLLGSPCPRCHNQFLQIASTEEEAIQCPSCSSTYLLHDSATFWQEEHQIHHL